jgi:phenylalanine-4-hydroxylase
MSKNLGSKNVGAITGPMDINHPIEHIPEHLKRFTVEQKYDLYTAIDHASWRYIMRVSKAFFKDHAHPKYIDGLKKTGISTDRIPRIEEMDNCLRRFGWRAVAVSGFIPPAIFLEFQSLGILPIACDMRSLEHLAYTPAPDIVHEAAGHAPILADPEYAAYLRRYGRVARMAIFSDQDMGVYEAIRNLSEVKEDPKSTDQDIEKAQTQLDLAVTNVDYDSEATLISRMNWWTAEYGLVGTPQKPLIYGAGLLSSVGESHDCFKKEIKKIPLTLDCIETSYDITKPQPQLFVTPNFETLTVVLEEMANRLACRMGGVEGLKRAQAAKTVTSTELDSGLQISGILENFFTDKKGEPCFLKFKGPVQLSYKNTELSDHSAKYHKEGFSTPIGLIKGLGKSADELTAKDLEARGFKKNQKGTLEFESGITLTGIFQNHVSRNGGIIIYTFEDCTVTKEGQILFKPEWGTYDMACGIHITAVFGDAADRAAYIAATGGYKQTPRTMKSNLTEQNKELASLYAQVRKIRDEKGPLNELQKIHKTLQQKYPQDWLLRLEILELVEVASTDKKFSQELRKELATLSKNSSPQESLINRGLELLVLTD